MIKAHFCWEGHAWHISSTVNNAGVGLVSVLESIPVDTAKKVFDVNFFGVMRMLKAVLPGMKARQDGLIINLSGVLGVVGKPFNDIFSASKFAVEGLTESLVPVLNQFNIRFVSLLWSVVLWRWRRQWWWRCDDGDVVVMMGVMWWWCRWCCWCWWWWGWWWRWWLSWWCK